VIVVGNVVEAKRRNGPHQGLDESCKKLETKFSERCQRYDSATT
jgi:hypothetical protein